MEDICNFLPSATTCNGVEYFHFVYEADINRLSQPFVYSKFYAHLVFRGKASLNFFDRKVEVVPGTLFFSFPYQSFELDGTDDFSYLYISFNGPDAPSLLENINITKENNIFPNFGHVTDFWMDSIRRINPSNANTLTESVLLYTLSFINGEQPAKDDSSDRFESILRYICNNFTDPSLTILKISDIFFYNKKYLSALFVKNKNVKFKEYLNSLRINRALELIGDPDLSVSEISEKCGFSDPYYFSKVFKKITGLTPTEYRKKQD